MGVMNTVRGKLAKLIGPMQVRWSWRVVIHVAISYRLGRPLEYVELLHTSMSCRLKAINLQSRARERVGEDPRWLLPRKRANAVGKYKGNDPPPPPKTI